MQIKLQLGKLKLNLPLSELIESQQQINNLQTLPVSLAHALALDSLPNHHNDPFDRLLIAQANVEDVFLVSKDAKIAQYSLQLIWWSDRLQSCQPATAQSQAECLHKSFDIS